MRERWREEREVARSEMSFLKRDFARKVSLDAQMKGKRRAFGVARV